SSQGSVSSQESESSRESALFQESASSHESELYQESASSQESTLHQESASSYAAPVSQRFSSNDFHIPFKDSTRPNLPLHSNASIKNPTLGGVRRLKRKKTTIINNYYNITADSVTFN
ncbi:4089_t:CDS:1, partial [Dentiscutata heterogama]